MPLIKESGRYTATAKTVDLGQSAEKGTPYVSILFETEQGEDLTAFLYLSDAALERTVRTLREVFGFNDDFGTVKEQVTGKQASIVVEAEEYEGKSRMKVKWINTVGGGSGKPLENASTLLAQLSAKAKRIAAVSPAAGRTAAVAARPAQVARPAPAPKPAVLEDDVPF